ncbi:MAG: efflux transporter outer membrane subunit [Acidobacteriota bacterium]
MRTALRYAVVASLATLLTGCLVGPNYKNPNVPLPVQFRGTITPADEKSLADTKWEDLFPDPVLRQLVTTALKQNFNLQLAAERVLQSQAQLDSRRANLLPFLNIPAQWTATRGSSIGSLPFIKEGTNLSYAYTQLGLGATWEVDLWGRLRRMNESARAQMLASEENRLAVRMALVAEVMNTYFELLEQDRELSIGEQTRDVAQNGLRLTTLRRDQGVATGLDVHQAEQLLYTATAQIAAAKRNIAQTENALSLLMGEAPGDVARGSELEQVARPADLPPGLPSSLLTRRPDIRSAEQMLISANAEIGVARAQYFPALSLNAFLGGQSRRVSDIFTDPARFAFITPATSLPIFHAGQIRANVRVTEAQQRQALLTYQETIFTGLRDASDALVANAQTREQVNQQQLLVAALTETTRLSRVRYEGGLDSFLQVLDSQRNLFQGQLVLAQLRMVELQSVVGLYRALGGGWQ